MWDSPENSFAFRAARFLAGSRGALGENGISHFGCGQEMELARRIKSCRCLAIPQGKALDADYMRAVGERE